MRSQWTAKKRWHKIVFNLNRSPLPTEFGTPSYPLDLNLRLDQAGSREPKRWGVLTGCGKETYLDILDQAGDKAL